MIDSIVIWSFKMAVYKNKYGLWSIRFKYKDNDNKWQQKNAYGGKSGFGTKKEALEKEIEVKYDMERKLLKPQQKNNQKTLGEVIDEVILDCQYYMKETSIKTTKQALQHAKSLFDKPIVSITPQDLRQIILSLERKNLSVGTIDKIYYKLNLVFKYALENEYIQTNPLRKVRRIKKPDELDKNNYNIWKLSEFQEFIYNVKEPLYYTLFSLLYYTGMRRGEALSLQWKHIDLNKGTIDIKQTLSNIHSVKEEVLTPPKTKNSKRLICIPQILINILKKWYQTESKKIGFSQESYVFGFIYPLARNTVHNQFRKHLRIGSKGYGYTYASCLSGKIEIGATVMLDGKVYYNEEKKGGYKEWKIHVRIKDIIDNPYGLNYIVEIALPYLRIHDLRHSCVSLMVNNVKTQQSLVAMAYHFGHSVETMLNTYSHLFTETEQALIQEFDQIIEYQSTSTH